MQFTKTSLRSTLRLTRLLLLLAVCWLFGSPVAQAQQNLFNIPSADLTPKNKYFFQQQVNILAYNNFESKSHLVYGLGKGWEVGLNVVNVKADFRRLATSVAPPEVANRPVAYSPLIQATGQKFFFLTEHLTTSIGTQIGVHPTKLWSGSRLTHFTYNLWAFQPRHHLKFVAGAYVSDRGTVGFGNRAGMLFGFEAPVAKKLLLMGDIVTGTNASAVSVLGFNYLATKRIQLCLGAMLPNPRSQNSYGVVFELNLLGFDDDAPSTSH